MSWSWFPTPAFTARIAALCALIHSLVAIGIAAQQLIALTRAHIHPQRTKIMQYILFGAVVPPSPDSNPGPGSGNHSDLSSNSSSSTPSGSNTGSVLPLGLPTITVDANLSAGSGWRHFSWQIPTMLLGNSIVFTLIALAIAVFTEAKKAVEWRTPEIVTAICVAVSLSFSVTCYFISWYFVEWQMQEAIALDT
jgi:hypothetical protein